VPDLPAGAWPHDPDAGLEWPPLPRSEVNRIAGRRHLFSLAVHHRSARFCPGCGLDHTAIAEARARAEAPRWIWAADHPDHHRRPSAASQKSVLRDDMKRFVKRLRRLPRTLVKRLRAPFEVIAWSAEARRHRRDQPDAGKLVLPDREALQSARAELAAAHDDYVRTISHRNVAISLPLAAYLLALIRERRPVAMADIGSGFSTFVISTYAPDGARVLSVDHSADWLEKTRRYLGPVAERVELKLWSDFESDVAYRDSFDLVLHDVGGGNRSRGLALVMSMVRVGGVLILDDMHMRGYRSVVLRMLEENPNWRTLSLWPETRELVPLNRHAWIALRIA
jgi:predicted O-methyltransferase YrrM